MPQNLQTPSHMTQKGEKDILWVSLSQSITSLRRAVDTLRHAQDQHELVSERFTDKKVLSHSKAMKLHLAGVIGQLNREIKDLKARRANIK